MTVTQVLYAREKDLGEIVVRRVLPSAERAMVGPMIFFDHIGPAVVPAGGGVNVRPHPHIGLATVTYLFEGSIVHRDSLGFHLTIEPGAVNWMTAGAGIVHSERPDPSATGPTKIHGIQLWVALPREHEECEASFHHYPAADIPELRVGEATVRGIVGEAYGVRSPVKTVWRTLYADVALPQGAALLIDVPYEERAVYVAGGSVVCDEKRYEPGALLVLESASEITAIEGDARALLIGGDAMDGPRFIEWNFVASDRAKIEEAKRRWKVGAFPKVPGDEVEFIPLPE